MEGLGVSWQERWWLLVFCFKLHERNPRLNPFCIRYDVLGTHGRWLKIRRIMLLPAGGWNSNHHDSESTTAGSIGIISRTFSSRHQSRLLGTSGCLSLRATPAILALHGLDRSAPRKVSMLVAFQWHLEEALALLPVLLEFLPLP